MWMVLLATAAGAETDELAIKKRPAPASPGLQAADGDVVHCFARLLVDVKGKPSEIDVKGCDERFAAPTRTSLTKWRWEAPSAPTHTVVSVSFSSASGTTRPEPCASTVTIGEDGAVSGGEGSCVMWMPPKIAAPESRQTCRVTLAPGSEATIEGCEADGLTLAQSWVDGSDWGGPGTVTLDLHGPDADSEPVLLADPVIESTDLP